MACDENVKESRKKNIRGYWEGDEEEVKEKKRKAQEKRVETLKKKREEKQKLEQCMKMILDLKVTKSQQIKLLNEMGIDSKSMCNATLLMTALFRKGLTGDVSAIREIRNMMNALDSNSVGYQNEITINLISSGDVYEPNEEDELDILSAEYDDFPLEDEEEWD